MSARRRGWAAIGGVLGPLAFIAAWSILGARTKGYSPIEDPISRLAAAGASTQPAMTAGLLAFAIGVGAYATTLPKPARAAAMTTALASVGIAALPLDSSVGGAPHAVAAGVAYASLAATPILAAPTIGRRVSVVTGLVTGAALLGSVLSERYTGLFQRTGLTVGDAWIMATAVRHVRQRA